MAIYFLVVTDTELVDLISKPYGTCQLTNKDTYSTCSCIANTWYNKSDFGKWFEPRSITWTITLYELHIRFWSCEYSPHEYVLLRLPTIHVYSRQPGEAYELRCFLLTVDCQHVRNDTEQHQPESRGSSTVLWWTGKNYSTGRDWS